MPKIAVAGHWELEWNTPIKEAELWNLMLRDFSVNDWRMFPVTGIRQNEWREVLLREYPDLPTLLQDAQDYTHVYLEPNGGVELEEFEHPENAMYIFGSARFRPSSGNIRPQDKSVYIKTIQDKGLLWPTQVLPVVLYDRLKKMGGWETPEPFFEEPWK